MTNPEPATASVNPAGTVVILSNGTVHGSVGIAAQGSAEMAAPSSVTGNVYTDPSATVTGNGTINGTTINLSQTTTNHNFFDMPASASVFQATQTALNVITSATTIVGNGGTNVIDITGNIALTDQNLVLKGSSADYFIVNVSGNLTLNARRRCCSTAVSMRAM